MRTFEDNPVCQCSCKCENLATRIITVAIKDGTVSGFCCEDCFHKSDDEIVAFKLIEEKVNETV